MENVTQNMIDYLFWIIIVSGVFSMAFLRFIDAVLMFSPIVGRKILAFVYTGVGIVLWHYDFKFPGVFLLLTGLLNIVNVLFIEWRINQQKSIMEEIKEEIQKNERSVEQTHSEGETKKNEGDNSSARGDGSITKGSYDERS